MPNAPTGDSILTDENKQFVYVILSFIASIVYVKKVWYEYWGIWLMLLSFILFTFFSFMSRKSLFESLSLFSLLSHPSTTGWWTNYINYGIQILIVGIFVFVLASLIILVDVATTIVRKKHEGNVNDATTYREKNGNKTTITGKENVQAEYKKRAFQITDFGFLETYTNGARIYNSLLTSIDSIIVAFSFLILFVYSRQFASFAGLEPITTDKYKTTEAASLVRGANINIIMAFNNAKLGYTIQTVWLIISALTALVSSIVGISYSADVLKIKSRLQDS